MKTRPIAIPCKACGASLSMRLESREFYYNMIANAAVIPMVCLECGFQQQFTAWDIIFQIASLIVPSTVSIQL
jgi:hypothetical protein